MTNTNKCTNCGKQYRKYTDWSNCDDCAREAYTIFSEVGYTNIQHSGGCCPLVRVDSVLNCKQEKFVVDRGWRSRDNGLYYSGPWLTSLLYATVRWENEGDNE